MKMFRLYYEKESGGFSSADYPLNSVTELENLILRFETENHARVIDVSYFPNWHISATGGVRVAFPLKIFRVE